MFLMQTLDIAEDALFVVLTPFPNLRSQVLPFSSYYSFPQIFS